MIQHATKEMAEELKALGMPQGWTDKTWFRGKLVSTASLKSQTISLEDNVASAPSIGEYIEMFVRAKRVGMVVSIMQDWYNAGAKVPLIHALHAAAIDRKPWEDWG